jgi:hypothetical protein
MQKTILTLLGSAAPAWTNQSRWSNYDGALSAPAGR